MCYRRRTTFLRLSGGTVDVARDRRIMRADSPRYGKPRKQLSSGEIGAPFYIPLRPSGMCDRLVADSEEADNLSVARQGIQVNKACRAAPCEVVRSLLEKGCARYASAALGTMMWATPNS